MKTLPQSNITMALCDYCGLPSARKAHRGQRVYCCLGCQFADGIARSDGSSHLSGPASALGLATFFTMNVVMMTMALWSYTDGHESPFESSLRGFLRFAAMACSAPVFLLLGRQLVSHAISGLKRGQLTTDLLLATGVVASFAVSVANTLRDAGHVYYEVGCTILVLVTLGRWLEATGRSNANAALDQLEQLIPDSIRKCVQDRTIDVKTSSVIVGDRIRVIAGERIPLDGRIRHGRAIIDEQFFTGEGVPLEKNVGDPVLGGSLNLDGDIIINVTKTADQGALSRLVEAVRTARLAKGRYQQLSDRWSQWFFPLISLVSLVSLVFHGLQSGWDHGLLTALSVILIACPCALALSTPLAIWAALTTAAGKGVLFRSGAAIENLSAIQSIYWDKTGTLTTGQPRVVQLQCEYSVDQIRIERLAAAITAGSNHLFSKAVREFVSGHCPEEGVQRIETVAGRGLRSVASDGCMVALGSMAWMSDCGFACGPRLSGLLNDSHLEPRALTAIGFDGLVQGLFVIEETIRAEAREAIECCRNLNLSQTVLTGDRKARAAFLTSELALPVRAELMPEDKLRVIQEARIGNSIVAMVGDGLNDAPALAGADVGIALGCGADVSRDSADVCLLPSDLRLIPWACLHARRTVRVIQSNLAWSFGYNSVGVAFAAAGYLHPAMAAALMVISSLMVLGNSLRLLPAKSIDALQPLDSICGGRDSTTTSRRWEGKEVPA